MGKNIFLKIKILILSIIFLFSIPLSTYTNKGNAEQPYLSRVKVFIANVRYEPDLKSKIIGRLKENLLVEVIDIKNDWAKISLKGFYFRKERKERPWGFIHRSLIERSNIKPQKILGLGRVRIRYNRVNIRENSSSDSNIIGRTRKGVVFGILKREQNWVTVIIPELKNNKVKTGYIYSPLTENYKPKNAKIENKEIPKEEKNDEIIITGNIDEDLTLQENFSYVFTGAVKKLKDVKLIIEPGAIIDLTNCQLTIEDELAFKGSTKNPIILNTTLDKKKPLYAEIKGDKILFNNCLINGSLRISTRTKDSSIKMIDSEITGEIEVLSFKKIEVKRVKVIYSEKGLHFIESENILVTDSLFLNNNSALHLEKNKNIRIKYNTFHQNRSILIADQIADLSDNFWYGDSLEKIMSSISSEKKVIIEPRLLYPSEDAPSQMYEHVLYPEKTDENDIIELELFFNRDMDTNSVPLIKIDSKKLKKPAVLNIQEQEWISGRSWFARMKLPEGIKPGQYKILYSNIDSLKQTKPVMIEAPEISVLRPTQISIKSFTENDRKFVTIKFSGDKIFNILLYRQTETKGYRVYRKWKYRKNLKRLTIPVEFDDSEKWVDFEAFATDENGEILAKSQFIRVNTR